MAPHARAVHDDPKFTDQSDQRSELHRLIAKRMGVLPNFFRTAASAPGLIDGLWDFARSAYFDSPLPRCSRRDSSSISRASARSVTVSSATSAS
jgi:hypothetical protein